MYTAINEIVYHLLQSFGGEGKRLWKRVKSSDTLPNLIGAELLSLAFLATVKSNLS